MEQQTAHGLPKRLALIEAHERLLAAQDAAHQAGIHEQLTGATARITSTMARLETLLARLLRHEDNGR